MDVGLVNAYAVADALGVNAERICEWAREGIVPFEARGKNRRLFRLEDVRDAIAVRMIRGRAVRSPELSARLRKRDGESGTGLHACSSCGRPQPPSAFPASGIALQAYVCRECRREEHRAEREQLSDSYVKDQLRKATGLAAGDMPRELVEVHRAHLMVVRSIREKEGNK